MALQTIGTKYNAYFQQTMLRIKDPKVSVPFYQKHFGMNLVHKYDFPKWKFSLYFLETSREGAAQPEDSERYLWDKNPATIELTHNWGSETDDNFKVNNGNVEPNRGFGHIAFNCDDVYASCKTLEDNGCKFKKKPDEGRMKGLAFALDPDGYWLEIVQRTGDVYKKEYNLSQTMIRIKDPAKSIPFYRDHMGMTLIREIHFPKEKGDFSLYFFGSLSDADKAEFEKMKAADADNAGRDMCKWMWQPVLELTHNHGTENDEKFSYHDGNKDPQGFGHIGFSVDNLKEMCKELITAQVPFHKKPEEGAMDNLAFVLDPDGYRVELVGRGATFKGVGLVEPKEEEKMEA